MAKRKKAPKSTEESNSLVAKAIDYALTGLEDHNVDPDFSGDMDTPPPKTQKTLQDDEDDAQVDPSPEVSEEEEEADAPPPPPEVVHWTDFNAKHLGIHVDTKAKRGLWFFISLTYKKTPFVLQLPVADSRFGISSYKGTGPPNLKLDAYDDSLIKNFCSDILDPAVVALLFKHQQKIWGHVKTKDVVEDRYRGLCRPGGTKTTGGSYPDSVTLKVIVNKKQPELATQYFNLDKKPVPADECKDKSLDTIVAIPGLNLDVKEKNIFLASQLQQVRLNGEPVGGTSSSATLISVFSFT